MKVLDISGQRFGKLVAINSIIGVNGSRTWICACDCGGTINGKAGKLKSGDLRSCGCAKHADLRYEKKQALAGNQYGRLVVVETTGKNRWGWDLWRCHCECGKEKIIEGRSLIRGLTKSCGCLRGADFLHGDCRGNKETDIYNLWGRIKERCNNPKRDNADRYYLRGVKVCDEWLNNYEAFRDFCVKSGYKKGLQIDRINSDGDYCPDNCRFVTPAENTRNRAATKLTVEKVQQIKIVLLSASFKSINKLAELYAVSAATIRAIKRGDRWADV